MSLVTPLKTDEPSSMYCPGQKHRQRTAKSFPKQALVLTCLQYKSFENTVRKGEIAHDEQFLLFLQCFYLFRELSTISIKFEIVVC